MFLSGDLTCLSENASYEAFSGAVLGLVGSAVFVTCSASTTSDVFFLAICFACSVLAAKALLTRSGRLWLLTGAADTAGRGALVG